MDIALEEDREWNLAMPLLKGEVPKEWADKWWLDKMEKSNRHLRPYISNLMAGIDDEDEEDIYS